MIRPVGLDHVVLRVPDVEATVAWWTARFDVEVLRLDAWRRREVPFVSLRLDPTTIIDLLEGPRTGDNVDHLAIVVDLDAAGLAEALAEGAFEVVMPPGPLFGAQGTGVGCYVRDGDGNLLELRTYR